MMLIILICGFVIYLSVIPNMFSECGVPAVSFDELADEASKLSDEPLRDEVLSMARTDSIAIVLYTSGSTGVPKGI